MSIKRQQGLGELYRYRFALQGAALILPGSGSVTRLMTDPRVDKVVPDRLVNLVA